MVVRKFEAQTLEQALALVKQAMGPDALILSTAHRKGKWFNKPIIEVAAAMPAKTDEHYDDDRLAEIFPHRKNEIELNERETQKHEEAPRTEGGTRAQAARSAYGARGAIFHNRKPSAPLQAHAAPVVKTSLRAPTASHSSPAPSKAEVFFEDLGFSQNTSREFVQRITLEFSRADRNDDLFMNKERVKLVSAGMKTLSESILERRKSWALVGNPGVGKTATCVKLALHMKAKGLPVSLVSADKRKLIGEQELSTYARMAGIPFSSVFQENREKTGTEIIDTPAMGFVQQELAQVLERVCRESSVVLVLDAGQRLQELMRSVEESECLAPVGIFFTRVDMVQGAGIVHDLLKLAKLPLLGMSMGAGFKNSIRFFEPADLARTLLKIEPQQAANV